MNEFAGFARPVIGGYHAMLRTAGDGEAKPMLSRGGKPALYATESEALQAVVARLTGYLNGSMRRDGETLTGAKAAANAIFRKGRMIPVVTAGRARG